MGEEGEVSRDDGDINTGRAALDEVVDGKVNEFILFVPSTLKKMKRPGRRNNNTTSSQQETLPTIQEVGRDK